MSRKEACEGLFSAFLAQKQPENRLGGIFYRENHKNGKNWQKFAK
jgi:hypothetical protein